MLRFHSQHIWQNTTDLTVVVERSNQLKGRRETRKNFKTEFRVNILPETSRFAGMQLFWGSVEGRSKLPSEAKAMLSSAFAEFFAFRDLGLFHARLSFEWKGKRQRRNYGCSVSYGFNKEKGNFRISFRPENPKPYTVADLEEVPKIIQALDDLGFGKFSLEEVISNKPYESSIYFARDQIVVQIQEITSDAVGRMLAVAYRFGSGKIFDSQWSFGPSDFKPTSEECHRLLNQLTKDKPEADEYQVELGYRIEKVGDYELPRAFCAEGEDFPHPIAEFKPSRKKCLLCVQVSKAGYRFGLHTNEALSESQFGEIEKTLGIAFEREPYRKT